MREIKFRAWDNQRKKFKYPKLWDNSMPSNWNKFYVLQQFTGLKDKNGTEIYEGDLIKWSQWIIGSRFDTEDRKKVSKVVFNEEMGAWSLENNSWNLSIYSNREVIGNIYENYELSNQTT
jgi:uncharacterized phage protein (TIGR01671 family)